MGRKNFNYTEKLHRAGNGVIHQPAPVCPCHLLPRRVRPRPFLCLSFPFKFARSCRDRFAALAGTPDRQQAGRGNRAPPVPSSERPPRSRRNAGQVTSRNAATVRPMAGTVRGDLSGNRAPDRPDGAPWPVPCAVAVTISPPSPERRKPCALWPERFAACDDLAGRVQNGSKRQPFGTERRTGSQGHIFAPVFYENYTNPNKTRAATVRRGF